MGAGAPGAGAPVALGAARFSLIPNDIVIGGKNGRSMEAAIPGSTGCTVADVSGASVVEVSGFTVAVIPGDSVEEVSGCTVAETSEDVVEVPGFMVTGSVSVASELEAVVLEAEVVVVGAAVAVHRRMVGACKGRGKFSRPLLENPSTLGTGTAVWCPWTE